MTIMVTIITKNNINDNEAKAENKRLVREQ